MSSSHRSTWSVRRRLAAVAAGALVFSLAPATSVFAQTGTEDVCEGRTDSQFSDEEGSVHADNINCAADYGVVNGFTDGTYKPDQDLSRAQMASIIAQLIETSGATLPTGDDAFIDDEGSVHEDNINDLEEAGVVNGKTAVTYDPGGVVSRAQMASFVSQGYDFAAEDQGGDPLPASTTDHFTDDEGSVHEPNINRLADAGIVSGVTDTTYAPTIDVSRGQTATFAMQAAEELEEHGLWNPPAEPVPGLAITPTDAAQNDVSTTTAGQENRGARTYTVTGLDNDQTYDIALFPQAAVNDDGTFDDANSDNNADNEGNVTNAVIEVVNGASPGANVREVNDVSPVNGQITFTIDSQGFDEVTPVIWDDEDFDDDTLDLVAPATANANPKAPAESVGVGGDKTWVPTEAPSGVQPQDATVQLVDREANFFVAGNQRFDYGVGDLFRYDADQNNGDDTVAETPITFDQWETALSVNDIVDLLNPYSQDFQNTFGLDDDIPGTPTDLAATSIGALDNQNDNFDVKFEWNAPSPPNGLIDSYTVTVLDDNTATTACDGAQAGQASSASTTATVNDLANDTYCATVVAQSESENSGTASTAVFFTVQKGDADTTAPTMVDADLATDAGTPAQFDTGDVIEFGFSEEMSQGINDTGSSFRFTDPDGAIYEVRCVETVAGLNSTEGQALCEFFDFEATTTPDTVNNDGLRVTLHDGPVKVGGSAETGAEIGPQVPGTVSEVGPKWDDKSGNQLDLANSSDKLIDNEL